LTDSEIQDTSTSPEVKGESPEDKANVQLDNLADILRKRGIRVDRPTPLDFSQAVRTPDFETQSMFGCMRPRDVIATVGNEMIEATMSYRCRWFEYLCYRPLREKYFKEDPNMRWEAAFRPRLTDASFKEGYLGRVMTIEDRLKLTAAEDFVTTEEEPLFDAAELARMGKDVVVRHGFTANLTGIDWLRRHFPDLRIHRMNFPGDPCPIHIGCTFVPFGGGLHCSTTDVYREGTCEDYFPKQVEGF
jgi:glycine amidinotransferase